MNPMLDELRRLYAEHHDAQPWLARRGAYTLELTEWIPRDATYVLSAGFVPEGTVLMHPLMRVQIARESGRWPISDLDLAALIGWHAEQSHE
jgi:hypothetical protein